MRYLKLYCYFLQFSFSKALEFRFNFFFRIFMDLIYYLIQFLFFEIIYLHTPLLAGWTPEELRIFIGAYLFVDALNMSVFANNSWWLPQYINNGSLDYYLTKPISSMFFLSLREFAANSFINLIVATSLLIYFLSSYSVSLSTLKLASFFILLINGTLLYFLVRFIFSISTFWSGSPRGFGDLFFSTSHAMERPDKIFTGLTRKFFMTLLPFSVMASIPTRFLFEKNSWQLLTQCLLTTFVFYLLALFIWGKGLKRYSSASS